jgi:hypothetical protein
MGAWHRDTTECNVKFFHAEDVRGDSAYPFLGGRRIWMPAFIVFWHLNVELAPRK